MGFQAGSRLHFLLTINNARRYGRIISFVNYRRAFSGTKRSSFDTNHMQLCVLSLEVKQPKILTNYSLVCRYSGV